MTTPIKTQCPHCHTSFNLPLALLNQADAKARCRRCQQFFLVNAHLIVSANNQPTLIDKKTPTNKLDTNNTLPNKPVPKETQIANNKKTVPEKKLTENSTVNSHFQPTKHAKKTAIDLDSNLLIHDDMEIDETPDPIMEYDSLDEMDAWLTQLDTSPSNTTHNINNADPIDSTSTEHDADTLTTVNIAPSQPPIATTTSPKSSVNADPLATPANKHPQPAATAPISSATANNIHASVAATNDQQTNENAWLETLLKEQNDLDNSAVSDPDDIDLAPLLTSMGTAASDEEKVEQARVSKIQARMQSSSTATQNPIATALWAAGCLVLMLLLLAQYVIFNVDTLVKNPAVAARLQAICSSAACSLPQADITALTMTKLAYRPSQVKASSTFSDVQADLINASAQAQLLPSLKVSIYGDNAMIGEFIAQPKDYLLSTESQIAAGRSKSVMFTVPIAANQISQLLIIPIY